VFLVDGHDVVRSGLRWLLERDAGIEVVGESSGAAEALRLLPGSSPQVVVIDARLPDGDGVDVCRRVREADPSVGVLVLTSCADDATLFAAIEAGASGFLLKRLRGDDIVNAVQTIAAGDSLLDECVVGTVLERLRSGPPGRFRAGRRDS